MHPWLRSQLGVMIVPLTVSEHSDHASLPPVLLAEDEMLTPKPVLGAGEVQGSRC
jgi:hypothetical protein